MPAELYHAAEVHGQLDVPDEPTGNLDSAAGTDVMSLFEELSAGGTTLVVITHDASLARRAARRVEVHHGRITGDERAAA